MQTHSKNSLLRITWIGLLLCAGLWIARASSVLELTTDRQLALSDAACRGLIAEVESFRDARDGQIYTRAVVRVEEAFKGTFPAVIQLTHRGGVHGNEGEHDGFAPLFQPGEERLLFLSRRPDGSLFASAGAASALKIERLGPARFQLEAVRRSAGTGVLPGSDVTDQAGTLSPAGESRESLLAPAGVTSVTGLLVDGSGTSARFILPDRGQPIPYLVDAAALPAGITLTQALNAVQSALAAWEAVTSLKFTFEGFQNFGQASANVPTSDGKIRIQLHDTYNYIGGSSTLGIGGRGYSVGNPVGANWGSGGNVAGNEFHKCTRGFVVLKHTHTSLQNAATLAEVLCHEIGHVLSMAHSSENPSEPNATLREAVMYFRAHGDGRGAALGSYDPPIIQQVHPPANTPPYTFPRVMDIVTASSTLPNIPGLNQVELRGYDLQTTNLTLASADATAGGGTFSWTGNLLKYTPLGFISGPRLDPATSDFYDLVYARFSDGVNASPYVHIRVLSYNPDTRPNPAGDGIPDNWMTTYFGSADPTAGANRQAGADFDGDGFTNLQEYRLGSNPTLSNSNLRITASTQTILEWQAKPYELYELHTTTNFSQWKLATSPLLPATAAGTAANFRQSGAAREFFRIQKVP